LRQVHCNAASDRFPRQFDHWRLSDGFLRKDAEIAGVNSKLESEQALVAQLQKKIKELQVGIRRSPP